MQSSDVFDYRNSLAFLEQQYIDSRKPEYRDIMYMLLELYFDQDYFNRKHALQELETHVPKWVEEAESIGREFDLKWTIITREGGKAWSEPYQPQWNGFLNLVDGLKLVNRLNESDPSLYYTVVTQRRAEVLHKKATENTSESKG